MLGLLGNIDLGQTRTANTSTLSHRGFWLYYRSTMLVESYVDIKRSQYHFALDKQV